MTHGVVALVGFFRSPLRHVASWRARQRDKQEAAVLEAEAFLRREIPLTRNVGFTHWIETAGGGVRAIFGEVCICGLGAVYFRRTGRMVQDFRVRLRDFPDLSEQAGSYIVAAFDRANSKWSYIRHLRLVVLAVCGLIEESEQGQGPAKTRPGSQTTPWVLGPDPYDGLEV